MLDLEDLKAAKNDMIRRHQIRQKIKARCEHLDKTRYGDDILGLKSAKLLRASPKPEPMVQRSGFGRGGPRRYISQNGKRAINPPGLSPTWAPRDARRLRCAER